MSEQPKPTLEELREGVTSQLRIGDHELKKKWSRYIYDLVFLTILFQIGLTIAIGRGWLSFLEYRYVLYMVFGENFLQIIGMGYIVANHLFPNNNKHAKRGVSKSSE